MSRSFLRQKEVVTRAGGSRKQDSQYRRDDDTADGTFLDRRTAEVYERAVPDEATRPAEKAGCEVGIEVPPEGTAEIRRSARKADGKTAGPAQQWIEAGAGAGRTPEGV